MLATTGQNVRTVAGAIITGAKLVELFSDVVENIAEVTIFDDNSLRSTSPTGHSSGRDRQSGNRRESRSSGSGSDDDYDENVWQKFKESKPQTMRHLYNRSRTFRRVGDSKFWLSRDHAGHGGSHFKLYIKKGNSLDFIGSVPKTIFIRPIYQNPQRLDEVLKSRIKLDLDDFNLINKAESHGGEQIKMNDLKRVS